MCSISVTEMSETETGSTATAAVAFSFNAVMINYAKWPDKFISSFPQKTVTESIYVRVARHLSPALFLCLVDYCPVLLFRGAIVELYKESRYFLL